MRPVGDTGQSTDTAGAGVADGGGCAAGVGFLINTGISSGSGVGRVGWMWDEWDCGS